jgi:hypothetical protein
MPRMPSSETAMIVLNDALQAVNLVAIEKSRFQGGRLEMRGQFALWREILAGVFDRIWPNRDASAEQAALGEDLLIAAFDHLRALELLSTQTRTWEADDRQVIWLALTRIIAPGAGRRVGYWTLDFDADKEMSGGALWFLPQIEEGGALRLPMSIACEHLAEIARSRKISLEEMFKGGNAGVALRRFQSWRLDGVLPGVDLMQQTLDSAIANLKLDREAAALRRRFLIARAVQWAHQVLVTALTPSVAPTEGDPLVSKALQVWALFRLAHDLTVDAGQGSDDETQARFQALIPGPFREEVFAALVVSPALPLEYLSDRLSHRCAMLEPGAPLEDLFEDHETTRPRRPASLRPLPAHGELGQLCERMNDALVSDNSEREAIVRRLLKEAAVHPRAAAYAADLAMFDALHELNKGNGGVALTRIDHAWGACAKSWPGGMASQIAQLRLGLGALYGKPQETAGRARDAMRLMSSEEAERFDLQDDPQYGLEDLTRHAAHVGLLSETRLYPGAASANGLEAFEEALNALFTAHRRNEDLSGWVKRHRLALSGRPDPVSRETGLMMLWKGAWNAENGGLPPQAKSALRAGVLEALRRLPLKVLSAHDWKRQTLLALAVDGNDRETFDILIEREVPINAQDFLGRTALHAAALVGEDEMFMELLVRGADLAVKTCFGRTPFAMAAYRGRHCVVLHSLSAHRGRIKDDLPRLGETLREIIEGHEGSCCPPEAANIQCEARGDSEKALAIILSACAAEAACSPTVNRKAQ